MAFFATSCFAVGCTVIHIPPDEVVRELAHEQPMMTEAFAELAWY